MRFAAEGEFPIKNALSNVVEPCQEAKLSVFNQNHTDLATVETMHPIIDASISGTWQRSTSEIGTLRYMGVQGYMGDP